MIRTCEKIYDDKDSRKYRSSYRGEAIWQLKRMGKEKGKRKR